MSKKNVVPAATKPSKTETPTPAAKPVVTKAPIVKVEAARHAAPATKLEWLVKANPKRPGSAAHGRAQLYWGAKDVAEYLAKGGERIDLAWDADHGFVALKG